MDNVSNEKSAAQPQQVDWFSFHQGPSNTGGDRGPQPGPVQDKGPGQDPYDKHQGPGKGTPTDQGPGKPYPTVPKGLAALTLYDVAEGTLKAEGKKGYKQDDIYFRLNDMMVAHGHKKANIDGRNHINDHMLPNSWNFVDPKSLLEAPKPKDPPKEPPKDQPKDQPKPDPGKDKAGDPGKDKPKEEPKTPEEKARADYQKQVEAALTDKYSLPPIEKGKGYYDAVAKAHPDWKPKQVMDEAKRVRHLNGDKVDLKVGERISTISKDERAQMIAKAMAEYDEKKKTPTPAPVAPEAPPENR